MKQNLMTYMNACFFYFIILAGILAVPGKASAAYDLAKIDSLLTTISPSYTLAKRGAEYVVETCETGRSCIAAGGTAISVATDILEGMTDLMESANTATAINFFEATGRSIPAKLLPVSEKAVKNLGVAGKIFKYGAYAIKGISAAITISDQVKLGEYAEATEVAFGTAGEVGGGLIGGKVGAATGAWALGALCGSVSFGVGALPCAAVGGAVGGILGSWAGSVVGKKVGEMTGQKVARTTKQIGENLALIFSNEETLKKYQVSIKKMLESGILSPATMATGEVALSFIECKKLQMDNKKIATAASVTMADRFEGDKCGAAGSISTCFVPEKIYHLDVDFSAECNKHDKCYESAKTKPQCDKELRANIMKICRDNASYLDFPECSLYAGAYWVFVMALGNNSYEKGQETRLALEKNSDFVRENSGLPAVSVILGARGRGPSSPPTITTHDLNVHVRVKGDVATTARSGGTAVTTINSTSASEGEVGGTYITDIDGSVVNQGGVLEINPIGGCAVKRNGRCCVEIHRNHCVVSKYKLGKKQSKCSSKYEKDGRYCYRYSDKEHAVAQ